LGQGGEGEPPDDAQEDWREAYRREMERRLGRDWESVSPGTWLKTLGWARVEDWASGDRNDVVEISEVEWDPVVRVIINRVRTYLPDSKDVPWYDLWLPSDEDLASLWDERGGQEDSDSPGSSSNSRQIQDHIVRMLPILQIERPFQDPDLVFAYDCESKITCDRGYVYVERWAKEVKRRDSGSSSP
jgi:hypothetical protein